MFKQKRNFAHIPVLAETKTEIDNLKKELSKKYPNATYEELVQILLRKNNNITLPESEIRKLIGTSRGVIF
jgi:hypothetical protein